jgi:hypothetical protein
VKSLAERLSQLAHLAPRFAHVYMRHAKAYQEARMNGFELAPRVRVFEIS